MATAKKPAAKSTKKTPAKSAAKAHAKPAAKTQAKASEEEKVTEETSAEEGAEEGTEEGAEEGADEKPAEAHGDEGLPETKEVAELRAAGREAIEALKRLNDLLRPLSVKLNADERKSGVGKMLKGEAEQLVKVARYAMKHPELVKGFAAKDGGADLAVFEGDLLAAHLATHEAARSLREEIEGHTQEMLSLLGDLAIHRGLLARPVLLKVYKVFAQVAQNDAGVYSAIRSVIEFFDRPSRDAKADEAPSEG